MEHHQFVCGEPVALGQLVMLAELRPSRRRGAYRCKNSDEINPCSSNGHDNSGGECQSLKEETGPKPDRRRASVGPRLPRIPGFLITDARRKVEAVPLPWR